MGRFEDLRVWQMGKNLAVFVYETTGEGSFSKDYGLRDQIRRATVSIPSNIGEGDELGTDKQAIRFFYTAKGSATEVLTQAIIAFEIGYITEVTFRHIEKECLKISGMLTRLIQSRMKSTKGSIFTRWNMPPYIQFGPLYPYTLRLALCPPAKRNPI